MIRSKVYEDLAGKTVAPLKTGTTRSALLKPFKKYDFKINTLKTQQTMYEDVQQENSDAVF